MATPSFALNLNVTYLKQVSTCIIYVYIIIIVFLVTQFRWCSCLLKSNATGKMRKTLMNTRVWVINYIAHKAMGLITHPSFHSNITYKRPIKQLRNKFCEILINVKRHSFTEMQRVMLSASCQQMSLILSLKLNDNALTHWGRDKMADIFQTTVSNAFSWMKMFKFRLRFQWSLFPRVQLTIFQHWVRWWLGAGQATSHYLNQWWLDYRRIYASLGLNELSNMFTYCRYHGYM